jgi:hypothetical protein
MVQRARASAVENLEAADTLSPAKHEAQNHSTPMFADLVGQHFLISVR